MRSRDWSESPLGPVGSWPQSLRTSVSIMLSSGFAVVVAWGPEFIFLYNDRYRPILGATKHPMALGNRSADIFPEVWDMIGPLFRKALAGETVALDDQLIPLDRNGYLEECYFTLSYSPIRDESGGVGGMLAIVAETSDRVQGERRLRTLRDLASIAPRAETAEQACDNAARSLALNPADVPFALLYLLDPEGSRARIVCSAGLDDVRGDVAAQVVALGERRADRWPLADAARSGSAVIIDDLRRRFGPLPGGAYPEPTHTAMVLPLTRPGVEHPYGFLVAGVSPRRAIDDKYHGFFELAAEHVATAITNALSHETERRRAEALAEIDRAKTAFFSNVSHEFRTPLTLMLAPIEDLLARDVAREREVAAASSQRPPAAQAGQHAPRLLADRGGPRSGGLRTDGPRGAHRATSRAAFARRPRRGSRAHDRLPAAGRAGLRRSRHVGKDRAQPRLERVQVHVRGYDRRPLADGRRERGARRRRHRDRDRRRTSCRGCSSVSTGSRGRDRAARGVRHRPRARAGARAHARRHRPREESPGRGLDGHGHGAARPRAPARGARTRRAHPASTALGAAPFVEEALRWLPGRRTARRCSARRPACRGPPPDRRRLCTRAPRSRSSTTTPTCGAIVARVLGERWSVARSPTERRRSRAIRAAPPDGRRHRRHDAEPRRLRPPPGAPRGPADRDHPGRHALGARGREREDRGARRPAPTTT